jgi:anti-sigma regulatory factor (Ser/Thr protein kinase)
MMASGTLPFFEDPGLPVMPTEESQELLVLDSRLTELSRVQSWAEELANELNLNQKTRYEIRLCLEEALANIVIHGYRREPGHPVVIRRWIRAGMLFFAIEDEAAPFALEDDAASAAAQEPASLESLTPGGNGIPLLRHFAGSLAYERLAGGNQLTMGFALQTL